MKWFVPFGTGTPKFVGIVPYWLITQHHLISSVTDRLSLISNGNLKRNTETSINNIFYFKIHRNSSNPEESFQLS